MLELYIKNNEGGWDKIDSDKELSIPTTYEQNKWLNPEATINDYSKTVTIVGTPNNNKIFKHLYRLDYTNSLGEINPNERISYRLLNNGELYSEGYLTIDSVTNKKGIINYNVTLYGGIGNFFYSLMYDNDGNELSLANVYYELITENPLKYNPSSDALYTDINNANLGMPLLEIEERTLPLFNYDKMFALSCWNIRANKDFYDKLKDNNIYKVFCPILGYTGYHEDYDNNKILFNQNVYNPDKNKLVIPYSIENNKYSAGYTDGWNLIEASRDLDQIETRDIRSHYLPLGMNMKFIYDAIKNTSLNNGFKIDDSLVNGDDWTSLKGMYLLSHPFDWRDITINRYNPKEFPKNAYSVVKNIKDTRPERNHEALEYFNDSKNDLITLNNIQDLIKDTQPDISLSFSINLNREYLVTLNNPTEQQEKYFDDNSSVIAKDISSHNLVYNDYNANIVMVTTEKLNGAKHTDVYIVGTNLEYVVGTTVQSSSQNVILTKEKISEYIHNKLIETFNNPDNIALYGDITINDTYMYSIDEYSRVKTGYSSEWNSFPMADRSEGAYKIKSLYTTDDKNIRIDLARDVKSVIVEEAPFHVFMEYNYKQDKIYNTLWSWGETYMSSYYDRLTNCHRGTMASSDSAWLSYIFKLTSYEIYYGNSSYETHELTKTNILQDTMSPYEFLKSIANTFNWKFEYEKDTIKICSHKNYFQNKVIDIADAIDMSSIEVKPTNINYKTYVYNLNTEEENYPYYLYKKKYGVETGTYKYIPPKYNLNTDTYNYCENNKFIAPNVWRLKSSFFYDFTNDEQKIGSYYNRAFIDSSFKCQYWNNTRTESKVEEYTGMNAIETIKLANVNDEGINAPNEYEFFRLSWFDKENKQLDYGNNVALYMGQLEYYYYDDEHDNYGNTLNGYFLSDNIDEMFIYNGKPCHLMCDSKKTHAEQRFIDKPAFGLNKIPWFTDRRFRSDMETGHIFSMNMDKTNKYQYPIGQQYMTLYDRFHKPINDRLLNGDNKILTVKYKLSEQPIQAMRRIYRLNNKHYILNKINDYQPNQKNKFFKCEFVSIDDYESIAYRPLNEFKYADTEDIL